MKTLGLLVTGLLIGAAGYLWLYGPKTVSTGTEINQALAQAAGAPEHASVVSAEDPPPVSSTAAIPARTPASPVAPTAEASHEAPAPAPATTSTPGSEGTLLLPVQGLSRTDLHDTFTDARSEGRVHDAIDIMAAAGTPVLAVADGTVEKLFDSKRGGLTIYQFEPSGRYAYYYAHLQRYAEGLAEKQPIKRGQVIGYVGSTGNANAEAPHLHFAIFRLGPERHWWEGEALNPYPVLHDGQPL
ncbi:MAG TPA: peptidoglycan DD-metalloendopeptidase family protein [Stenotrophomonas sp.]|nr:peptidoglycan DD-metalloendopeptidase family protein [Stenotrophomonas sp.]